jgi:hypothetical protein
MHSIPTHIQKVAGIKKQHLIFSSAKAKVGSPISMNWNQFTYSMQMSCHKIVNSKLDAELFSPWSPREAALGRTKECVDSTSLLAFDLDKIDTMDVHQVSSWCSPYAHFAHTTYSHGLQGKGCFRVYIPLEIPISIDEYQITHAGILETIPEIKSRIDSSSSDIARCFFMPSCPKSTESMASFAMSFSEIYASPITKPINCNTNQTNSSFAPPPTLQGNRNNLLASYAGKAYVSGLTPQEFIEDALQWGAKCQPPMDSEEIHSVVNSMWQTHIRNNPAAMPNLSRLTKYLRTAEDLRKDPPLEWTVRGVLPNNGIGAIYGAPSSGKTFLALDLAFAIATGKPWFGNPTIQRSVAYIALEGSHGIRQRMAAWEISNSTTTPKNLYFVTASVSVEDDLAWRALSKEISNTLGDGAIVFIDTLNRASPTADENTSASMGRIIEAAKYMASLINGFVMFVHHAGKDSQKGLRGHSSLLAALDTVIKVSSATNQRIWSIEKSKDSEIGICNAFELKTVELGSEDIWGITHTSCTVSQGILKPQSKPIKGKHQQQVINVLTAMLLDDSSEAITQTDLEIKVAKDLDIDDPKRAKERAKSAVSSLIDSGHLLVTNGVITPS